MDLRVSAEVPLPRARTYQIYRDHLIDLLPYLPNVQSVEPKEVSGVPPVMRKVAVWRGGGDIPAAVRSVLGESMLAWTDTATWDESRWHCAWSIETHSFKDALHCHGENRYIEIDPTRTRVDIEGKISVDATKIRGVPKILARSIGPTIERFLAARIGDNLKEIARGVARFAATHSP